MRICWNKVVFVDDIFHRVVPLSFGEAGGLDSIERGVAHRMEDAFCLTAHDAGVGNGGCVDCSLIAKEISEGSTSQIAKGDAASCSILMAWSTALSAAPFVLVGKE